MGVKKVRKSLKFQLIIFAKIAHCLKILLFFFLLMLIFAFPGYNQRVITSGKILSNFLFSDVKFIYTDSGMIIYRSYKKSCKSILTLTEFIPKEIKIKSEKEVSQVIPYPKFLTVHGNISYDFFYRSKLDTPLAQQNFQQHTERVSLSILLKEKYPLKIGFALRQSNSPYFRNFADVNFQFDQFGYQKNIKQDILNKLSQKLNQNNYIPPIKDMIEENKRKYSQLKNWLESPATLQKIIEEREREYFTKSNTTVPVDPIKKTLPDLNVVNGFKFKSFSLAVDKANDYSHSADSMKGLFTQQYEAKLKELDSLSQKGEELITKSDSIRNSVQQKLNTARQKIYKATTEKDLNRIAAENGVDVGLASKFSRGLSSIKTFSVGRSMINYTELTAQNIAITGVNVEYHPSYYTAFAAGKIDYRVRDFLNRYHRSTGQYLVLGRIGIGNLQKRALIFTMFKGRKNISNYGLNDTVKNNIDLIGYSLESILKKDDNTSLSFEVAKSTKPITGNFQNNKPLSALVKFKDDTNLGINIKAKTIVEITRTKLSGFYRKTGENFQSFSLFSYNTNQVAWLARADQDFFRQKLTLTGMLRRNDFTNPFTDKTYKTSTVFKSVLINVRIPKYPVLSFGYYPGSQLYLVNKETIRENAYYILNGSVVYSYIHKGIAMNSSVVYNQYFNQATDSGFVLYKGINLYAMQTVYLKSLQLQSGVTINKQPELTYSTIEASADYAFKKCIKIGIGGKFNKLVCGSSYWGERIQLSTDLKNFGIFQFQYEKSYLPTISHALYPVEIGRISWYKYF